MIARRSGDGQYVVQRHRYIRNDDLPDCLTHGLSRRAVGSRAVGVDMRLSWRFDIVAVAQFLPHLPAHPQQQEAAGQQQANDLHQLDRNAGETDAQDRSGHDSPEDDPGAEEVLLRARPMMMALSISCKNQVNDDDLHQRG